MSQKENLLVRTHLERQKQVKPVDLKWTGEFGDDGFPGTYGLVTMSKLRCFGSLTCSTGAMRMTSAVSCRHAGLIKLQMLQ